MGYIYFEVFSNNANTNQMQIQIISTNDELQQTFDRMLSKAIEGLPLRETTAAPIIVKGDELKEQLGVTIQTIIRWRNKGKIPFMQIGSSIRYDLNAVIKALEVTNKKGAGRG